MGELTTSNSISKEKLVYKMKRRTYILFTCNLFYNLNIELKESFLNHELVTSVPSARVLKFFTVFGTVLPKRPMTILPASSPPIDMSKNT